MFERFSDRARRAMAGTQDKARLLGHNRVDTEHILLSIVEDEHSKAALILRSLGIEQADVQRLVEQYALPSYPVPEGHIPFTPRAKRTLELALREALQLGSDYIGTEHLLLALFRAGDSAGAEALADLGATRDSVLREIIILRMPHAPQRARRVATARPMAEEGGAARAERMRLSAGPVIRYLRQLDKRLARIQDQIAPGTGGNATAPDAAASDDARAEDTADETAEDTAEDTATSTQAAPGFAPTVNELLAAVDRRLAAIERHLSGPPLG